MDVFGAGEGGGHCVAWMVSFGIGCVFLTSLHTFNAKHTLFLKGFLGPTVSKKMHVDKL